MATVQVFWSVHLLVAIWLIWLNVVYLQLLYQQTRRKMVDEFMERIAAAPTGRQPNPAAMTHRAFFPANNIARPNQSTQAAIHPWLPPQHHQLQHQPLHNSLYLPPPLLPAVIANYQLPVTPATSVDSHGSVHASPTAAGVAHVDNLSQPLARSADVASQPGAAVSTTAATLTVAASGSGSMSSTGAEGVTVVSPTRPALVVQPQSSSQSQTHAIQQAAMHVRAMSMESLNSSWRHIRMASSPRRRQERPSAVSFALSRRRVWKKVFADHFSQNNYSNYFTFRLQVLIFGILCAAESLVRLSLYLSDPSAVLLGSSLTVTSLRVIAFFFYLTGGLTVCNALIDNSLKALRDFGFDSMKESLIVDGKEIKLKGSTLYTPAVHLIFRVWLRVNVLVMAVCILSAFYPFLVDDEHRTYEMYNIISVLFHLGVMFYLSMMAAMLSVYGRRALLAISFVRENSTASPAKRQLLGQFYATARRGIYGTIINGTITSCFELITICWPLVRQNDSYVLAVMCINSELAWIVISIGRNKMLRAEAAQAHSQPHVHKVADEEKAKEKEREKQREREHQLNRDVEFEREKKHGEAGSVRMSVNTSLQPKPST